MKKILAVSSGGGHWQEMMLIKDAFHDVQLVYANTFKGLAESSGVGSAYVVRDCNRSEIFASLCCALGLCLILARERPDIVISTGAAPGLIAVLLGKLFGARTIWIDSIANSDELSLSGRLAGWFADLWLTQWSHLVSPRGPHYWGSVL